MASLPPVNRYYHALPHQSGCDGFKGGTVDEWQIGRKDQPSIRLRRLLHSDGDRVAHSGVATIFKMPRQAAVLYRIQSML